MFRSFSIRFFITYTIATLVMLILIYYGFNYFLKVEINEQNAVVLKHNNEMILSDLVHLESFRYDAIKEVIGDKTAYLSYPHDETTEKACSRVLLILDADSQVIFSPNKPYSALIGKTINADYINASIDQHILLDDSTLNNTFKEKMQVVVTPVNDNNTIKGYIVSASLPMSVEDSIDRMTLVVFIAIGIMLSITFTVVYAFSNRATHTIDLFNTTAKKIASGQLNSRVTLSYDESDVGDLARNFNYMAEELERVDSMRKEFIANVSHDLRSPLTSIGGFAQAMLDGTIPPENQEKYLKIVLAETEHLTNLTHNILLLTQMENNVIKLEMNPFDINKLLRKVMIQFEPAISKKLIEVKMVTNDDELMVMGDLNQIQRVIYNIVHNAIKFSPNKGDLIIETQIRQQKVYVSISDTGPGMSKEEIKYMWIRFHKGDKSRGKEKGGFGIGLSIVKEIISAHNQQVDVYSQKGKGTTFVFSLDRYTSDYHI